jgi:hypothetical protein
MMSAVRGQCGALLVVLASTGCALSSAPRPAQGSSVAAALFADAVAPIEPADLTRLLGLINPGEGEAPFEQIPWLATVWEGRIQAAAQGKPMVAFLMSGHPMGCT